MSLFGINFSNKFTPKATAPRKVDVSNITRVLDPDAAEEDLGLDVGPINLRLGDQDATFEDGQWIPESGPVSGTYKENVKLKRSVQQLEEENNLLKLKCDILLDMLTETTAEAHLQRTQIDKLSNNLKLSQTQKSGLQIRR